MKIVHFTMKTMIIGIHVRCIFKPSSAMAVTATNLAEIVWEVHFVLSAIHKELFLLLFVTAEHLGHRNQQDALTLKMQFLAYE